MWRKKRSRRLAQSRRGIGTNWIGTAHSPGGVIVLSGDWQQERKFPSESCSDAEISGVRDYISVHASVIWPVAAEIGIACATAPCPLFVEL